MCSGVREFIWSQKRWLVRSLVADRYIMIPSCAVIPVDPLGLTTGGQDTIEHGQQNVGAHGQPLLTFGYHFIDPFHQTQTASQGKQRPTAPLFPDGNLLWDGGFAL